jgi:hypothetical protein
MALENYARDHNGYYPTDEETPEASLSLLYSSGYCPSADTLRGKTIPVQIVQSTLDSGGLLTPETCGWHYVAGLTKNDDPRLALLWDKARLGHNGQRTDGATEVVFVGGDTRIIHGDQWEQFLEEQKELLSARTTTGNRGNPALTLRIQMPDGEVVDSYSGPFCLEEMEIRSDGKRHRSRMQGNALAVADLMRWGDSLRDGTIIWELSLPELKLRSKPLEIAVKGHKPSKAHALFEMQSSDRE